MKFQFLIHTLGGFPSCFFNSIEDQSAYSLDGWPDTSTSPITGDDVAEVLDDLLAAGHLGVRAFVSLPTSLKRLGPTQRMKKY